MPFARIIRRSWTSWSTSSPPSGRTEHRPKVGSASTGLEQLPQIQILGGCRIRAQRFFHLPESIFVFLRRIRDDTIRRHAKMKVAHVGIIRRVEHTAISRDAAEDERFRAEVLQEYVQRGRVEA